MLSPGRDAFAVFDARPGGALLGSRARFSTRLACPPCYAMFAYGGSGEGRSSASRCVLRSHERRRGVGARLEVHDRRAGAGIMGLSVDDVWTLFGGTFIRDGGARHRLIACDNFVPGLPRGYR